MFSLKGHLGLLSCVVGLTALVGCGGGGSSSPSNDASLRMTMAWPEPSRSVPNAANSVVTTVTVKGKEVARAVFVRPNASRSPGNGGSTTITLSRLPAGEATVAYAAYPNSDGTGVAQATGSSTMTLRKGVTAQDTATMASTVESLAITPNPLTVVKNSTLNLDVEARDAQNRVVLLDTTYRESLTWSSSDTGKATVEDGTLTGVAVGQANVSVSMVVNDAGDLKSATSPVTISAPARTLTSIAMNITGDSTNPYDFSDPSIPHEQLDVTGTYSDGSTDDLSGQASWTSDDTTIVEMQGQNMVRKGSGTTIVRVSVGGFNQAVTVRTAPARTLVSLTISPGTIFTYNSTAQVAVTATYSDSSVADVTDQVTFTLSNPSVCTISSQGLITFTNGGYFTTLTASVDGVNSQAINIYYGI